MPIAHRPTYAADSFLALACLTYSDQDGPDRWGAAARLLAEQPELRESFVVSVATADAGIVSQMLAADPTFATTACGPWDLQPLIYLAYARHDPAVTRDAVLSTARLLLDVGADPNGGHLLGGEVPPFTVLTGVFGEGEQGPQRQPRHPHDLALARLLLEAGADANDGQTLYNRMFLPDDSHLVLLFEHGLGSGDGGPWRARFGSRLESPAEMVRGQLGWAAAHGMTQRIALLREHGADLLSPLVSGRTPLELAVVTGHGDAAAYLTSQGADPRSLSTAQQYVGAALAGSPEQVSRLEAEHPGLGATVRTEHPALVLRAVSAGDAGAVRHLVGLGFDVNALGRMDQPIDEPWETALHCSAARGDAAMAALLLDLGANPAARDARFTATPAQWAEHEGHPDLAALLESAQGQSPAAD